uniref:Uncharacterized protein n=1 Tax=Anguilla anguilla TaxID=7936 RepID=A0A0E9P6S7_ANGAN
MFATRLPLKFLKKKTKKKITFVNTKDE